MKVQHLVFILLLISLFSGCQPEPQTATPTPQYDMFSFRVAMLFPRAIDADGWNQSGYQGLMAIEEELGAQTAYTDNIPEAEFEQIFRQYAEEGYDFIIGHGGQFVNAAQIVAEEFPRTQFAVSAIYGGNNRNLGAISLRVSEPAYMAGVIAALKTKTNHVAYIAGKPNRTNEETGMSFQKGAKAINPKIDVTLVWTDSWTDKEKALDATQGLIDSGADVLLVIAGQVAPDVHRLAEEAGILTIGWSIDQRSVAPNSVITSIIENMSVGLLQAAELARRGRWEGKQYLFGLHENALYFTPLDDYLTPEEETVIETIKNDILFGELDPTP